MRGFLPYLIPLLWLFPAISPAVAQEKGVVVDYIEFCGNKRTRENVLLRELTFQVGDTLPTAEFADILALNRYRLMNTNLFLRVDILVNAIAGKKAHVGLDITMEENFFLVPSPILEFADRNFNVWWVEQNRALNRINYGVDLTYRNVTGRRDELGLLLQNGYTRKFELDYNLPFTDRRQTLGLEANFFYKRNKEVVYTTEANRQQFFRSDDEFLFHRFRLRFGLNWRPGLLRNHRFLLGFHDNRVNPFVLEELNAEFLRDRRERQRFFTLTYEFTSDERDIIPYPLSGYWLRGRIVKEGLGLFNDRNVLYLEGMYRYYHTFARHWSYSVSAHARGFVSRDRQAFFQNRALGYENRYVRGFEYYVIDGMDFLLTKGSLRYELFHDILYFGRLLPFENLQQIPLRLYLTANLDGGWVNDPFYQEGNPLNNRWLTGGGVGLDVVVFYNNLFQLEYSFNDLGEIGLFLHYQTQF